MEILVKLALTATLLALVPVPEGLVTLITAAAAGVPYATGTVILILLTIVKPGWFVAPMLTLVTPVKLVPLIVRILPGQIGEGEKLVTVGACAFTM
jgi:hypothetical protein